MKLDNWIATGEISSYETRHSAITLADAIAAINSADILHVLRRADDLGEERTVTVEIDVSDLSPEIAGSIVALVDRFLREGDNALPRMDADKVKVQAVESEPSFTL